MGMMRKPITLTNINSITSEKNKSVITWTVVFVALFIIYCLSLRLWLWDWMNAYRPASIKFLSSGQLYPDLMSAPPWAVIPFLPFALFPQMIGGGLLFATNILTILFVARKLGASWLGAIAILFSYPAYRVVIHGQIDAFVSLGFILSPALGLFFLTMKPQISIGYVIFLAFDSWRQGRLKKLTKTFLPVSLMILLTIIIYGPFWTNFWVRIGDDTNFSLWPYGIPIGFFILANAIKGGDKNKAIISSPFLSPYLVYYSWIVAEFGAIKLSSTPNLIAISMLTWLVKYLANWP
jgi:hypothetical protein